MNKTDLRKHFRVMRESLSAQRIARDSALLCQTLAGWDLLQRAQAVLAYLAFRNELDLSALFDSAPTIQWVLPRVAGQHLILHPYDRERLVRHRFGMLEPASDLPRVAPSAVDLVLVPGVAFDIHGGRLGFGGGFYDRFLPTTPALRVGVIHEAGLVNALPVDPHDQRVDWVATPAQLLRCPRELTG